MRPTRLPFTANNELFEIHGARAFHCQGMKIGIEQRNKKASCQTTVYAVSPLWRTSGSIMLFLFLRRIKRDKVQPRALTQSPENTTTHTHRRLYNGRFCAGPFSFESDSLRAVKNGPRSIESGQRRCTMNYIKAFEFTNAG